MILQELVPRLVLDRHIIGIANANDLVNCFEKEGYEVQVVEVAEYSLKSHKLSFFENLKFKCKQRIKGLLNNS